MHTKNLNNKKKTRCTRPIIILLQPWITRSHGAFKHFGKNSFFSIFDDILRCELDSF